MTDDEQMDRWLQDAFTGDTPQLSPAFDAAVMSRVRRRRLTMPRRLLLAGYAVGATAVSAWTLREVDVSLIAASTIVSALVAVGLSRYARAARLLARDY